MQQNVDGVHLVGQNSEMKCGHSILFLGRQYLNNTLGRYNKGYDGSGLMANHEMKRQISFNVIATNRTSRCQQSDHIHEFLLFLWTTFNHTLACIMEGCQSRFVSHRQESLNKRRPTDDLLFV